MTTARVYGIFRESLGDGPGVRLVVAFQGCSVCCPDCQNKALWPKDEGTEVEVESLFRFLTPLTTGVTASGGEPMEQPDAVIELFHNAYVMNLNTMLYTGLTLEELKAHPRAIEVMSWTDYLKIGPYIKAERDTTLAFRGSRNQVIYRVAYPEPGEPLDPAFPFALERMELE